MTYLTVTTPVDVVDPSDGKLSLREAVEKANATAVPATIRFLAALEGQTLVLTGGELVVTRDLTIQGDRNHDGRQVTLDGDGTGRVLRIAGLSTAVELRNLTLANGWSGPGGRGGAILVGGGSLLMAGSTVRDSRAGAYDDGGGSQGGGIYASTGSSLTLTDSRITGNQAWEDGGGIATGRRVELVVRRSDVSGNGSTCCHGGGIFLSGGGSLVMEDSTATRNNGGEYSSGGALAAFDSEVAIARSTIADNSTDIAGGLFFENTPAFITDSTIAGNVADGMYARAGGVVGDEVTIQNSTVTGNSATNTPVPADGRAGGIWGRVALLNTIVAGNSAYRGQPDLAGSILRSNGHNIFGSSVTGAVPGDRQNVAPRAVFATIDPATGGGKLLAKGIVRLNTDPANPALSGADPITAGGFGQLGTTPRPQPTGSLPDIGAIEIKQRLSTSPTIRNDVLTGNGGANNLSGLAGNDLIRGQGGNDVLNGNDGSDVLEGGPGNDVLNGGTGFDIATFAGNVAVVVDLSANPATARRGGETDTLNSIEGIIGSSKADSFKGDGLDNEFQGGPGKDVHTGGGGRDLFGFAAVQDSPPGGKCDVIRDFVPGLDVIDVSPIDADTGFSGRQSFRWVGTATLTGAAQLGYYHAGGNTIVRASTDADAKAELEIELTGRKTLTATDFRL